MLLFYSNVSNFTQNLNLVFSWPKFDEGCWNYHAIPVQSKEVSSLRSAAIENGKIL